MNNRAAFIDAMQGTSDEYLIRHIKKKFPCREERIRKYTMAAVIYAAACLVAVLAIPLIIGGGDKPVEPGNDPVVIETVVTGTEGTETVTVTEESAAETEAVTVTVTVETTETTTTEETTTEATTEETTTETTTEATTTTVETVVTEPPVTEPAPAVPPELTEGQSINGDFVMFGNWVVEYFGNGGHVALPDGTTMIYNDAFKEKGYAITSLHIPKSYVGAIVGDVFYGLFSLEYYSVEEGHTHFCTVNGVLRHYNSSTGAVGGIISVPGSYTEFTIPSDVTSVSWCAFTNCRNMTYINVESGNETYISLNGAVMKKDRTAMNNVPPGMTELYIPAEMETRLLAFCNDISMNGSGLLNFNVDPANPIFSSPDGALYNKEGNILYSVPGGITEYNIPSNVTAVVWGAFRHADKIRTVVIPPNVVNKEEGSKGNGFNGIFVGCESLESVELHSKIELDHSFFYECTNLKTVNIPNGVTYIDNLALADCRSLEVVYIPDSVTKIGETAFVNSPNVVIYCSAGSTASQYAEANGIPYVTG